jgi:hypothetical protein
MDDVHTSPSITAAKRTRIAVERGAILAYRVFDTGDLIDLERAERNVPKANRVDLGGPLAEGLVIPARPLELRLGEMDLAIERARGAAPGVPLRATVCAHVYDFGAVSVLYEIPIPAGTTLETLTPLCDALYDSPELDEIGARHRNELVAQLDGAIEKPHEWAEAETFTVVFIEALSGASVEDLRRSEVVAKLLLGETSPRALSHATCEDVLKNAFSYLADDLVVLDWNSALVLEPSGSRVVASVLELATCQLLEFRYYDGILDRELGRVYDHVEKARPRVLRSPYRALTREVLRRFMELTEFTERVDNAIKSVGDFYLARVYLAAIRRFRVDDWRDSVEQKLELVQKSYELLKGEVEVSRSQWLEVVVVLLILIEVVAAAFRH